MQIAVFVKKYEIYGNVSILFFVPIGKVLNAFIERKICITYDF